MNKMKQAIQKLKNRAGYVSVETVIVAGLIIALGAYAISQFYTTSQATTEWSIDNINKIYNVTIKETPIP
ncbi:MULTISPECIES: hypothetical protein [Paenibacillus]|uniref:Class III signal peptide-containing protein n=1 Tax=Paenibacillus polymyxa (strain SC2) TaxID=886882 RepID=E3EKE1_PAEPS|nr:MULTISPECIES: hypothetical protein [Paenibacillus]ADO59468.1 hypothetical protein PPSC2_27725 [Paenibacillus polymyxa SC2]MBP1308700.1 hypothetical protein [Paenibacillus sp. 1182]WPQ59693.1 hypothetical protein SKN87_28965 [Paenibacillus polymyxa]